MTVEHLIERGKRRRIVFAPGAQIGLWTVIGPAEDVRRCSRSWCECACGTVRSVSNISLARGGALACGCQRDLGNQRKHGLVGTPEYRAWQGMIRRCRAYRRYVERGVTVCARWRDFESFLADMGQKPSSEHSLDRKNNDGHYEPGNCRWATRVEQAGNKSDNVTLERNGVTMCAAAWARETGIAYNTILSRRDRGWSDVDCLLTGAEWTVAMLARKVERAMRGLEHESKQRVAAVLLERYGQAA